MREPTVARPAVGIAQRTVRTENFVDWSAANQAAFCLEPEFAFGLDSDLVFGLVFESEDSEELLSFAEELLSLESEALSFLLLE